MKDISKKRPLEDQSVFVSHKVRKLIQKLSQNLGTDTGHGETGGLHLRKMIVDTLDECLLPPLGYFAVLAAEMIHEILLNLPVSSWESFACTCQALRNIVFSQAKHYFQMYCGSQKIIGRASFLPQLLHVCKQLGANFVTDLAQKPHTLIVPLGSYSAQNSPFKCYVPLAKIWEEALSRGLTDIVIHHLVARLSISYQEICCTEDVVPFKLLTLLNSGADDRNVKRVANAILHVLHQCKALKTKHYENSKLGQVIISFVRHAEENNKEIKAAFCAVLMLFDTPDLLKAILSITHEVVSDVAKAVTFVFDTARQYHVVLPQITLKLITSSRHSRRHELCTIIAPCPDLMSLPFDSESDCILDICRRERDYDDVYVDDHNNSDKNIDDPMEMICSPWFVLPSSVEQVSAMMRVVLGASGLNNTSTLSHFCSLVPLTTLRELPLGLMLMVRCKTNMEKIMLFTQVINQRVPFKEWLDADLVIRRFFTIKVPFADCKKFLLKYVDAQQPKLRSAMALGVECEKRTRDLPVRGSIGVRRVVGKKQLAAFCQKLLCKK